MKIIKTSYVIALIAIFSHHSFAHAREKRSFSWPSFFGGGGSSNVEATQEVSEEVGVEETAQGIEETPQQQYESSFQHLSPGYHYPIYRVHKFNGIHLRPMPISLVPRPNQEALQQPRLQLTQSQMQELLQLQFQQSPAGNIPTGNVQIIRQPNGQHFALSNGQQFALPNGQQFALPNGQQFALPNGQQFALPNGQQFALPNGQNFAVPNGQQFASSNGQQFASSNGQQFASPNGQNRPNSGSASPSRPIPPELQDLADQFGIKDASKLPSIEDAMGLLGTTTRAETIQTIKELAATPEGMDLIRQFLASDEGAAASAEPQSDSSSGDSTGNEIQSQPQSFSPQQQLFMSQQQPFIPQQQLTVNQQGLPTIFPVSMNPISIPHQQYGVPSPYPAKQHETYGLPNVNQAQKFNAVAAPYPGYYAPRSNVAESGESEGNVPHKEYNVPHEDSNSGQEVQVPHETYGVPNEVSQEESNVSTQDSGTAQVPHEEYGLPKVEHKEFNTPKQEVQESQEGQQTAAEHQSNEHEVYGLPSMQQAAFHQQCSMYNVPNGNSNSDQNSQVSHETYGLPNEAPASQGFSQGNHEQQASQAISNVDNNLVLSKPQEVYSIPNQAIESNEVGSSEYGLPNEQSQFTSVSHQTYGVPNQGGDQLNENFEQDITVSHQQNSPSALHTDIFTNDDRITRPHGLYSLPHQQYFAQPQNRFQQSYVQPQSLAINHDNAVPSQYGPSTQYNGRNSRTQVPIIRQIDNGLDRAHTNLELAERLTTTVRPEAGFLERITSWTKYFAPPAPNIPIVPPKVEGHINSRVNSETHIAEANSMPIPELPELDEPHIDGLPTTPQLPNIHIPSKFIMPPSLNHRQNVHIELPTFDSPNNNQFTGLTSYEVPHQTNPEPFDGQSVDDFVPDISHLPLQYLRFGNNPQFVTSYGTATHPHSYSNDDSEAAASEIDEQRVAVVLPQKSLKSDNLIENGIVDNQKSEETGKTSGPQRISSYDSYATGKLNRADDDAIIQLIPTQKPAYSNRGRQQLEDSSIVSAVATMTSGFRPIN